MKTYQIEVLFLYYAFRALRNHLLFQLLIVALSVSIFNLERKQKKLADFIIFFRAFSKLYKNKKLIKLIFQILIIHKPSPGSRKVPYKIWTRSVQPIWRLLQWEKKIFTFNSNIISGLPSTQFVLEIFWPSHIFLDKENKIFYF